MPGTKQRYQVTFFADDRPFGVFDTLDGGEVTAEEVKHRPGAMRPQKSYGGPVSVGNLTFGRVYENEDVENVRFLQQRVGRARCTVSRQPLDQDGNVYGRATTYTGVLQRVALGSVDSDSSEVDMWEIEVSTDGEIG